jgi:hypothetical protein
MVPLRSRSGATTALCREDGSVDIAWRLRPTEDGWDETFYALPDGTLFNDGPEDDFGILGADGQAAVPASYARLRRENPELKGRPALLRRTAGGIELDWNDRLFSLDSSGAVLSSRPLPKGDAYPLRDGFLVIDRNGIYFSDWNGTTRPLRAP